MQRKYADIKVPDKNIKPSIHDSNTIVLPGSQSQTAVGPTPRPPGPVTPGQPLPIIPSSSKEIPPANIPLVPPPPTGSKSQTAAPSSIPPPPIPPKAAQISPSPPRPSHPPPPLPPPPQKRKPRRFLRFLLTLLVLSGLSFAAGTWYSLISDNFHDFFTEYIPFGEDAVLYFEEREFRRRFPNALSPTNRSSTTSDSGPKVTIPGKSGLSWKVAEDQNNPGGSDLGTRGRHMSALEENKPKPKVETAQRTPSEATKDDKVKAVDTAKKDAASTPSRLPSPQSRLPAPSPPPPAPVPAPPALTTTKPNPTSEVGRSEKHDTKADSAFNATKTVITGVMDTKAKAKPNKMPEVDEPSIFIPITRIDPLKIFNADEPVVQDLVKILNDIITVVNADSNSGRFNSTITKAKSELAGVGSKIMALKNAEKKVADEKIKSTQTQFDNAARELVRRLEAEMRDQEARWKDEFETERDKISHTYEERLRSEVERSNQLEQQRVRNQLLEQAIVLKKQFAAGVRDQVETERDGRLSKLSELSDSVSELQNLTSAWNKVVDSNLKTQHLQVAVEAVRSSLDNADRPRPFIRELAALKEIAADDPIVNTAIASINPSAYQRGVPTSAQLIDRFRRVAGEVRKAALLPEDAGVASHAASLLVSRFLFKKNGRAVGDDIESVLTRTETLLEEGNLNDAAREMNGLQGWAKTLSSDWLVEVRRVLEVRQALDVSLELSWLMSKPSADCETLRLWLPKRGCRA